MTYALAQALGETNLDDLNDTLRELDVNLAAFNASWDSTIGTTVPPQFVMDIGQTLLDQVVSPFMKLRLEMAEDQDNFTITQEIREAGSSGDVMWQDRVLPVLLQAIAAQRNKQASMVIPADMRQRVVAVIQFYKLGYEQLRDALSERSWWMKLGGISTLAIGFLITASKAITQVKEWVKSGGKIAYDTVVGLGRLLDMLMKVGLYGGLAVVAYMVLKPSTHAKAVNPARRRRRRR